MSHGGSVYEYVAKGRKKRRREAVVALQDIHLVVGERVDRRLEH